MPRNEVTGFFKSIRALLRGNFLVVTLGFSWIMSWVTVFSPYESIYVRSLGGTSFMIGIYFAANSLIRAIARIPGGYICDTYGRKRVIVIGNFLTGSVWFLVGLAPTLTHYFVAQFIFSVVCFWTVAEYTIMVDSLEVKNRGLGFSLFWTIVQLTGFASPFIGGWILQNHQTSGLKNILFLIGLADLLRALVYAKFLKETLIIHRKKPKLSINTLTNSFTETFKTLKRIPRSLLGLLVVEVLFGFSWSLVAPFFVLYAFDVISLTPVEWGLIQTTMTGISLLARLPGGRLIDRYGKKSFLLILFIVDAPGSLVFIYSRNYLQVLFLFAIWASIENFTEPSWEALKTDLTPKEKRGKITSLFGILVAISSFFGSISGGYFYGLNPTFPFWIYIPFNIVAAVIAYFIIHEPEKPEE